MLAVLILVTILYIVLLAVVLIILFRSNRRLLYLPIFIAVGNECFWHLVGNLNYLFLSEDLSAFGASKLRETAIGCILDLAYLLFWVCGFMIICSRVRTSRPPEGFSQHDPLPELPFANIDREYYLSRIKPILYICVACLVLYAPLAQLLSWSTGYAHGSVFVDPESWSGARFPLLSIGIERVIVISICFACVAIALNRKNIISYQNIWPILIIIGCVVYGFSRGSRGMMIKPFIMLVLTTFFMQRKIKTQMITLGSILVLLIILSPMIRIVRQSEAFKEQASVIARIKAAFSEERQDLETEDQLARFNVAYISGVVYRETNDRGYAGLRPYYSLPFLLVPRAIWPEKPFLGSVDGTLGGNLNYLSYYWMTGDYGVSLNIGPGGNAYWIGGWKAVFGIALFMGMLVGFVWSYLKLAYHPIWLIVLLAVASRGIAFNFLYYDIGYAIRELVERGLLILALYVLTAPLGRRAHNEPSEYVLSEPCN